MSAQTEVVAEGAEGSQESLRVLGGFEALQHPFPFARRQVRILGPVVQPLVPSMLRVGQHSPNGRRVARQLIGDHDAWFIADAIDHLPKEAFGGMLISPRLYQDVQHDAVLIDRPPQPVAFATDLQQDLVEVPLVARSSSSTTEPSRVRGAERSAPLTDRLMADGDAPLSEQILNVAKAEVESKWSMVSVTRRGARRRPCQNMRSKLS